MDREFLRSLLNRAEFEQLSNESLTNNDLLDRLLQNGFLFQADWKYVDQKRELEHFFRARTSALDPGAETDLDSAYEQAIAQNDAPGDFLPAFLKVASVLLKKQGFEVVTLERGNDSYYLGLVKKTDTKRIGSAGDKSWDFRAWGSRSGEILYTVYCRCGEMNVWQLKVGEPLTDETCETCGTVLFDENGKSEFEVIRDYI